MDFTLNNLTTRTYPVAYAIEADNGDYKLSVRIDVLKDMPLLTYYLLPMPSYVIFERSPGSTASFSPRVVRTITSIALAFLSTPPVIYTQSTDRSTTQILGI